MKKKSVREERDHSNNLTKIATRDKSSNSHLHMNVAWSFMYADKEKWCIKEHFFKSIYDKIIGFESMTWDDIQVKSKKQNHSVSVGDLIKEARDRLEKLELSYDELFSLHLSSKERIYGILEQGILRILWYDPNHEICPSHKSHT